MTNQLEPVTQAVVGVVRELPDGLFNRLVAVLEQGPPSSRTAASVPTSARARENVVSLLEHARQKGIDERTVAAMLRAARAMQAHTARERVELVWTGPNAPSGTLYRTEQTLLEMIRGAKDHLLIVTFTAYKVDAIREAIRAAMERGVRVDLVLEQAEADGGRVAFSPQAALAERVHERLSIHVWPRDQRATSAEGRVGSLHAKCAVTDDRVLLVSSANLTAFALELNMELGVRVERGDAPRRVREHFAELVRRGVLTTLSVGR